jgi:hypothetical protein
MYRALETSTDRGWTQSLFRGLPDPFLVQPRANGINKFTDFDEHFAASAADYTITQAGSNGTFAHDATVANGVWLVDCNSTTAAHGANVQFDKWIAILTTANIGAFEVRCKSADIATGAESFVGLSALDTTIIGSSAITTGYKIGFSSTTDDNVLLFVSGTNAVPTASTVATHTFVEDTYVKLGFRVEGGVITDVRVNGTDVGHSLTSAVVPVSQPLVPSFVCQANGTTDPILHLDWMRLSVV